MFARQRLRVYSEANFCLVNELSNTIDLIPTLSKAEALFHRFEKKVETIDKRFNFPSAPVRQRIVSSGAQAESQLPTSPRRVSNSARASGSSASASGVRNKPNSEPVQSSSQPSSEIDRERIITPELRQLLSRKESWKPETKAQDQEARP